MRIFTPAGERRRRQTELKRERSERRRLARMQAQYEKEQAARAAANSQRDSKKAEGV